MGNAVHFFRKTPGLFAHLSDVVGLMAYAAYGMDGDCGDSAYSRYAFSVIPARAHPRVVCERP
jgi:hypothetical protein